MNILQSKLAARGKRKRHKPSRVYPYSSERQNTRAIRKAKRKARA